MNNSSKFKVDTSSLGRISNTSKHAHKARLPIGILSSPSPFTRTTTTLCILLQLLKFMDRIKKSYIGSTHMHTRISLFFSFFNPASAARHGVGRAIGTLRCQRLVLRIVYPRYREFYCPLGRIISREEDVPAPAAAWA